MTMYPAPGQRLLQAQLLPLPFAQHLMLLAYRENIRAQDLTEAIRLLMAKAYEWLPCSMKPQFLLALHYP